jgi:hypothetical protein
LVLVVPPEDELPVGLEQPTKTDTATAARIAALFVFMNFSWRST